MNITHTRSTTQGIDYAGKRFLIDPTPADKGAWPGFPGTARSELRNPLAELLFSRDKIINVDTVIVTHTHDDYWDVAATAAIPKALPMSVQHEANAALLRSQGFQGLRLLLADSEFAGVHLQKIISGRHGSDRTYAVPAMAERLGEACGVVFRHPQEKTLRLMGDTIRCDDIVADLLKLRPDVVVLNAGYAHVIGLGPIIIGKEDLLNMHFALPEAKIMAIHPEAVNHCLVGREEMHQYALGSQIADVMSIPQDGETAAYQHAQGERTMKLTDVVIVAVEGFSLSHYAVPCTLFGDSVSEIKRSNLHIYAERPGLLRARDGFALYAIGDSAALEQADIVVVPYWGEVDRHPPQALLDSPVRARDNGAEIVGLCLGAFVLDYAGLLDGRRAATHWEFEQDFQRLFPQVQLDINALYVDDQRAITSADTVAVLGCCLYLIRQCFGSLATNQIVRRMIALPRRKGGQTQFITRPVPKSTRDARINCLLDYLQQHIVGPHSLGSLARVVAMSHRTLTRHFARATGTSATDWLTAERLRHSQNLLEAGDLPVEQVAGAVGYLLAITWCQQFKVRFGVSPTG